MPSSSKHCVVAVAGVVVAVALAVAVAAAFDFAALGKREKQRLAAQEAAAEKGSGALHSVDTAERDFTKLTELADLLLNAGGELDIYSHKKEQLERWAAAVLPQSDILKGEGCLMILSSHL